VNHAAHEWVRGDVHTGTIDGYWGLLKRGVIGTNTRLPAPLPERVSVQVESLQGSGHIRAGHHGAGDRVAPEVR